MVPGGQAACQLSPTVRLAAPWMEWIKTPELADQPVLVRFGLWQNEQVGPSLRWPAWNVGFAPSCPWQSRHLALATMARRAV